MSETERVSVPTPDLRIVPVSTLYPHEEHDSQRSKPLVERLRHETTMINPPLVAPMSGGYVILDGANRVYAFSELNYPHILVQAASYESGLVELRNWQHIVAGWNETELTAHLLAVPGVRLETSPQPDMIARFLLRGNREIVVCSVDSTSVHGRNAALRQVVAVYQRNARLHRTATTDPDECWQLYPDALALVVFPLYTPADIVAAAQEHAYLPPGISRHIVHGRAIRVNYPLDALRDPNTPLDQKNAELVAWMQHKLANRQVRYYAEATYQFDE